MMGKSADRYFAVEPWRIVERGFDPEHARVAESVFSLANEHMGVRGYFDEGGGSPSLRGSYLGGVYELLGEETGGGYKGIVHQSHYMVAAADMLAVSLSVAGETLDLSEARFSDFERALELRTGLLRRRFVWHTARAGRVEVIFERLLSMTDAALEQDAALDYALCVDGAMIHQKTGRCAWRELISQTGNGAGSLTLETETTSQRVRYQWRMQPNKAGQAITGPRVSGWQGTAMLRPGEPFVMEKQIRADVCRAPEEAFPPEEDARWPGFEQALADNRRHYEAFWQTADVTIAGDPESQQGIRYCIFQMHQTYRGDDARNNIGAKGLTGEAYDGMAFWDSETYCLPYYLLTDQRAARCLLMYRYHTLPQAMERAKQLDLEGACYPIATMNGKEACGLWQHASLQMQPSTAVAYAVWDYAHQTGDKAFLHREGIEMLVQICRYLASRGAWNQEHTGYGYYGVMGPDEFHLMVNNNFYTNFMGKKTLDYTLSVLEELGQLEKAELIKKTGLTQRETAQWRACADQMILLKNDQGVFEQHEGYFHLPHLDIKEIPQTDFPLYDHWSYDRIYRTDMIKQPDVLMAMFLYPQDFTQKEKRANYDYYEPRCIHESSLSPSIHSILASELGRKREAADFFGFATRLDLDNFNRNTGDGLHTTSIAAAWITIVYGFGGLRTDGRIPALNPWLPEGWTRYEFALTLGESTVRVTVSPEGAEVKLISGEPINLVWKGELTKVGKD